MSKNKTTCVVQLLTPLSRISKRVILFILTLLYISSSSLPSRAQLIPRGYLEIPVSTSDHDFIVIPVQDKGLLLLKKESISKKKMILWHIIALDTDLNKKDVGAFSTDYEYELVGYESTNSHAFFLFCQSKSFIDNFQLFKFSFSNKKLTQFNIRHEGNINLTHFCVVNQSALFGGYIAEKPVALIYYMGTPSRLIAFADFFNKRSKLLDLRSNTNNSFNTVTIEENGFKQKYLITKIFSEWGNLIFSDSMYIDPQVTLTSGHVSNLHRDNMMVLGTYSLFSNRETNGLYAVPVNLDNNQQIKYHPFSMFNHFLDYMDPKRAEKVKLRSEKRIRTGKLPNYAAYLHPIKTSETKAGFLLLSKMLNSAFSSRGESIANATSYSAPMYNPYMSLYNFRSYPRAYSNGSASDNYTNKKSKYIQTVLALFDENGNLAWDHRLDISQIEHNEQIQLCDYIMGTNSIMIVCKKDNKLLTNTITPSTSTLDTLKIPTKDTLDIVSNEYTNNTGIKSWYDNYLCTWGYRDVRHRATPKKKQYVFYISKFEAL